MAHTMTIHTSSWI